MLFVEQTRPDSLGLLSLQQASVLSRTGTLLQLLKNLSLLKLKLRGDTIPVTIARSFFRALPSLRALRSLEVDLSQISFGQHGIFRDFVITALANALGQLSQLTNLQINLSQSRANIESLATLIDAIRPLVELEELELNLGGNAALQILPGACLADLLATLPRLRILRLTLRGNRLSHRALQSTMSALGAGGNLHALSVDLSQNSFRAASMTNLARSITGLRQLRQLRLVLQETYPQPAGLTALATAIREHPSLEVIEIDMTNNDLSNEVLQTFTSLAQRNNQRPPLRIAPLRRIDLDRAHSKTIHFLTTILGG